MGPANFVLIFFVPQIIVIGIIVLILKGKLNHNLINLAIEQLEAGRIKPEHTADITVVTHKDLSPVNRERIQKAFTKNVVGGGALNFTVDSKLLGGMIIKTGAEIVDFSLADRLRRAR